MIDPVQPGLEAGLETRVKIQNFVSPAPFGIRSPEMPFVTRAALIAPATGMARNSPTRTTAEAAMTLH